MSQTYTHRSTVGAFNWLNSAEKQRQLLIFMPSEYSEERTIISVLCEPDEHEDFSELLPEEAIDVFESEASNWISSDNTKRKECIAWLRENLHLVNKQWASNRIKMLGRRRSVIQDEIDDLRGLLFEEQED
jgi:hypothetical protein